MYFVSIDTETFLFNENCQIPKMVVATYAVRSKDVLVNPDGITYTIFGEQKTYQPKKHPSILKYIHKSKEFLPILKCFLLDDNCMIVMHNAKFDMAVFAIEYGEEIAKLIQSKYEKHLVLCTYLNEKFIRIATDGITQTKEFSLQFLGKKYLGVDIEKGEDTWRLRYGELLNRDLKDWPPEALEYALMDAEYTLQVAEKQGQANKIDIFNQCHVDWLCCMMTNMGCNIDQKFLMERYEPLQKLIDEHEYTLRKFGFKKTKPSREYFQWLKGFSEVNTDALKGKLADKCGYLEAMIGNAGIDLAFESLSTEFEYTQNKNNIRLSIERICQKNNIPIQYTAGGETDPEKPKEPTISTKAEFLADLEGEDEGLDALIELGNAVMVKGTFLDSWKDKPLIHCSLDVAAVTNRIICSKPNLANIPKKGRIRGCIIPLNPDTHWLSSTDWGQIELLTLGQILYSTGCGSEMLDAINSGIDLHCLTGAEMMGIPYERFCRLLKEGNKEIKDQRSLAKVTNFGGGGGMGAKTLCQTAKKQGVKIDGKFISEEQAKHALNSLKKTFPLQRYFNNRRSEIVHTELGQYYRSEQLGTDFVRMISAVDWKGDNAGYCAANNNPFQALAATILKLAIRRLFKQIWFEKNKLLNDVQPHVFVYDEVIAGIPKATAHESAYALSEIMIQAVKDMLPDIKVVKAEPALMERWEKNAETVFDSNGKLIPWIYEIHGKKE